ncbi:MAG: hypothetical protein AB1333_00525 [Patescibacteria group bacterium]
MTTDQKTRLGILIVLVLILAVSLLNWFKAPTADDMTNSVNVGAVKIDSSLNALGKKVDVTNETLKTTNSTLGDISGYTSDIAENAGNIANNTYYSSLESRRAEKAREDSVVKTKKLEKAQKAVEDAQKELEAVKNPNKPVVVAPSSNNPNGDLLSSIGTMIDGKLKPISDRLGNLETGQKTMETRMTSLETRMTTIETDVNKMTSLSDINARISLGEEGYLKMKKKQMREQKDCDDLSGNK